MNVVANDIKIKNKIEKRQERIIFFGIKNNLKLIKDVKEAFLVITFKIITKKYHPYKLLIISGIVNNNTPKMLSLILLKYLEYLSYDKIFNYIHDNYGFSPKIIHTDFEKSLHLAIENNINFKNKLIHSRCFFYFSKMIRGKLSQAGICKKKLTKDNFEIISNIELLCFISLKNIKKFQTIILEELKENKSLDKFVKYLKVYLFKLNPIIYNYTNLIEYFKSNNENKYLDHLYTTNNICETINSKLDYFLPKRATNNLSFLDSISKVIINDEFRSDSIVRKDYKSKSLIYLIEDLKFNDNLNWIKYEMFEKYINIILKKENNNINQEEIKNLFNKLYDIKKQATR